MKELVEYIARSIASEPDEVKVTEEEDDGRIILRLEVAP
ncbi:MAG TPA: RNA-binding protein, partial [Dehalococcoidia bacterium]|nr:RNA-binding protein [Dehalococcoidia bacterium]